MRDHFHVPDNYFLSHSVGCLTRLAQADLDAQFFEPWKSGVNWAEWMPVLDGFRAGMADFLSIKSANICPQTNVSSALTKILYSLPKRAGRDTILLSEQDFPTIGFVLSQAERQGYRVKFIVGDILDAAIWEAAMDDHVALVHVTHALSNTSRLLPVAEICTAARRKGVISVVDMAQSIGAVPVDVTGWNADFAIGTGVKFLCFGPGACFLYVSDHMLPLCEPIDVGWFSHENPFEMDIKQFRYAPDAMRFFGGTPSPAPFALGYSALNVWHTIGWGKVQAHIQSKLSYLCENTPPEFIISPFSKEQRGGTFVVAPKDKDALRNRLNAHHIRYDERKEGFRFSVHGYTADYEVELLARVLSGS